MDANIVDFGAVGDGVSVNTASIQQAIDACHLAGGGRVIVPPGRFVTGTIYLKDHVTLHVAGGATLLGSLRIGDYATDTHKCMYDEPHVDRCLIFARSCRGIGLEGAGTIDGQGASFPNAGDTTHGRPMLIRAMDCTGIRVRDLTLRSPGAWTSAWLYCDDIAIDGLTIHSRANWNGDGLDFDGCRNVRVSNCAFDTSDDSICLQASRTDRPCENVVVTNCIFRSHWAGMRIGLLSLGDLRNLAVSNCTFVDIVDSGLKIQMCEGGVMENMVFANLVMTNVPRPVFMTFNRQRAGVDSPADVPPPSAMRNFQFSNIRADSGSCGKDSCIILIGVPGHRIENVTFSGLHLTAGGGGSAEDGAVRTLLEYTDDNTLEPRWPEYTKLGRPVPCHGVYARHVSGLTLSGVRLDTAAPDERPAIVCDDVADLELDGVVLQGGRAESLVRLQNVRQAYIRGCRSRGEGRVFVRAEGSETSGITIAGDNVVLAAQMVSRGPDTAADAVRGAAQKQDQE